MEITRDLFLTDARAPLFAVSVASRDVTAHRVLTSLTAVEREAVAAALSAAVTALSAAPMPGSARSRAPPASAAAPRAELFE
jgi:hypothetical protein